MASIKLPFIAPVAGVSQYQDVVTNLGVGSRATVVHEPDNPYDANACAVLVNGAKVGYLPKALAERLVGGGGQRWSAGIVEVLQGETWGLRVKVVSELEEDATQEIADEPAPEPSPVREPIEVKAKSGRVLGVYVRTEGDKVIVRNADGIEVPYPRSLVKA